MVAWLSQKKVGVASGVMTALFFVIVAFVAEPAIKGGQGAGMMELQLAFSKARGLDIVAGWSDRGVAAFRFWIGADYGYLLSYSIFLAGLLAALGASPILVRLPLVAGALDAVENTAELVFLAIPQEFPPSLFFIHSVLASVKWSLAAVVIGYLLWRLVGGRRTMLKPNEENRNAG